MSLPREALAAPEAFAWPVLLFSLTHKLDRSVEGFLLNYCRL